MGSCLAGGGSFHPPAPPPLSPWERLSRPSPQPGPPAHSAGLPARLRGPCSPPEPSEGESGLHSQPPGGWGQVAWGGGTEPRRQGIPISRRQDKRPCAHPGECLDRALARGRCSKPVAGSGRSRACGWALGGGIKGPGWQAKRQVPAALACLMATLPGQDRLCPGARDRGTEPELGVFISCHTPAPGLQVRRA